MITKYEIFPLLMEACPSFKPQWDTFIQEWKDEKEDPPLYICLMNFAIHLINKLERKDTDNFEKIFEVIEKLHIEGDKYVSKAATIGLLESLQNGHHHNKTKPENFRRFLKKESEKHWNALYDFWEGKSRFKK